MRGRGAVGGVVVLAFGLAAADGQSGALAVRQSGLPNGRSAQSPNFRIAGLPGSPVAGAARAPVHWILFQVEDGSVLVKETMILRVPGPRPFLTPAATNPGGIEGFGHGLPAGHEGFQLLAGPAPEGIATFPDGLVIRDGLGPGQHEIAFAYRLHPDATRLTFRWGMPVPVDRLEVLVSDTKASVEAPGLTPGGLVATREGHRYQLFVGAGLAPGQPLALAIHGLPRGMGEFQYLAYGGLALLLVAGGAYPFVRRLAHRPVAAGDPAATP